MILFVELFSFVILTTTVTWKLLDIVLDNVLVNTLNATLTENVRLKINPKYYDFKNIRYYCESCTNFWCEKCSIRDWVYEEKDSEVDERPVCRCTKCKNKID